MIKAIELKLTTKLSFADCRTMERLLKSLDGGRFKFSHDINVFIAKRSDSRHSIRGNLFFKDGMTAISKNALNGSLLANEPVAREIIQVISNFNEDN